MRTFRIGFWNNVDKHDDETEFDINSGALDEMMHDLYSLWYDFCHENRLVNTYMDYIEEVV